VVGIEALQSFIGLVPHPEGLGCAALIGNVVEGVKLTVAKPMGLALRFEAEQDQAAAVGLLGTSPGCFRDIGGNGALHVALRGASEGHP
jgi:hypothetical protein